MCRFIITLLLITSLAGPAAAQDSPEKILTLAEAVKIALQNNPSIREAEAGKEGARADVQGATADFLPKASAQYSYARLADQPFQRVSGVERFSGDENAHHWDITLTQPLFSGFALTSKKQMAEIAVDIQNLERERTTINVSQDLRIAWFETLFAKRLGRVTEENVAALSAHQQNAQGFFRQGLISRNDLLKAEAALAQALQERERATADSEIARSRLVTILGTDLPSGSRLEDISAIDPRPYELDDLVSEAMHNSPILKSYRLGLAQFDSSITLARSTAYPTVALVGKYEQNGNDLAAETNAYTNDHNASIALTAKWDFYDWGKTRANVMKQKSAQKMLAEKMRAMEDQTGLEVKRAYLDLHVAEKNIGTARQGLEQAGENWRITELQYQNQVATSTDVLDSRSLLSQSEGNYFRALYGYRIALARLERTVGRK
ncbi:MAG: TolC family protein [Desulfoprunum sp.]|nr:TolC family protein [Desulfoprunum sp.]